MSPDCFAYSHDDEKTMAPHPDAKSPQATLCSECHWNRFGTAKVGNGKACKNTRRLAMVPATEDSLGNLLKAEVAYLKLPVTSVKEWAKHVRDCSALYEMPPFGVVTNLRVVPDPKSQFKVLFDARGILGEEQQAAAYQRSMMVAEEICFPYSEMEPEEQPPEEKPKGKKKY
jgi:hypothetical protein